MHEYVRMQTCNYQAHITLFSYTQDRLIMISHAVLWCFSYVPVCNSRRILSLWRPRQRLWRCHAQSSGSFAQQFCDGFQWRRSNSQYHTAVTAYERVWLVFIFVMASLRRCSCFVLISHGTDCRSVDGSKSFWKSPRPALRNINISQQV